MSYSQRSINVPSDKLRQNINYVDLIRSVKGYIFIQFVSVDV